MEFKNTLEKYKKIVDEEIELFFDKKIKEAENPFLKLNYSFVKDFILGGGKRLRPIAMIMAYNAVSESDEKLIYAPSLSVELFHNSTLAHDDVMDEDDFRRNNLTVYKKFKDWFLNNYGEIKSRGSLFNSASSRFAASSAILCGSILFNLGYSALETFNNKNSKKAILVYNKAYNTVAEGQIIDILMSFNNMSEKKYFDMITKKTAALFMASAEIGAILGNATQDKIDSLSNYALNMAIAFQIRDDIIDVSREMNKGHGIGSDIKKGKKTLLIIKALESADKKEKNMILNALNKEGISSLEISSIIDVLKSTGAIDYANKISREKIKIAKDYLKEAEISKECRLFFEKLADFMVERKI